MELKIFHSKHIILATTHYLPWEGILSQNKSYEGYEWMVLLNLINDPRVHKCKWIIGQNKSYFCYEWTAPRPEIAGSCWGINMLIHANEHPKHTYIGS